MTGKNERIKVANVVAADEIKKGDSFSCPDPASKDFSNDHHQSHRKFS